MTLPSVSDEPDLSVLEAYELTAPAARFDLPLGKNNTVVGVRCQQGSFVLKKLTWTDAALAGLTAEHGLLQWLATRDLPFQIPAPLPTRLGRTFVERGHHVYVLMPLLPGRRTDSTDPDQFQAVGTALGVLHERLFDLPDLPWATQGAAGDLDRIHSLLPNPSALTPVDLGLDRSEHDDICAWWRDALGPIGEFARTEYRSLPQQVIHGDYGAMNTLCEGDRVTAILDFESARHDARALDLASALCNCKRLRWSPELIASFCRGYSSRQTVTEREVRALRPLMALVEAANAIHRLGRQLRDGGECNTNRLHRMRGIVEWLDERAEYLDDLFSRHLSR